jgi:phosphoglycerate dehydrogenase-like enzyme
VTRMLHIAARERVPRLWPTVFVDALRQIGEIEFAENGHALTEDERLSLIRGCRILLTGWGTMPVPAAIAGDPGELGYICHVTGEMRRVIPAEAIAAGIPVTNWGDAPATGVAEGAMALLLASLKDLRRHAHTKREGGWRLDDETSGGWIYGLNVGIYGCGAIGRRFVELLRPFGSTVRVYDPYVTDVPDGCLRVGSLDELFEESEAVVIHAGLSDETRKSVTAELLAKLPKFGVLINTARGGLVDQDALFAELESGRLRAGLDVLDPDSLPPGHPAREWDNLILTAHQVEREWPTDGGQPTRMLPMHEVCLDNIQRFLDGRALRFTMDSERYARST